MCVVVVIILYVEVVQACEYSLFVCEYLPNSHNTKNKV